MARLLCRPDIILLELLAVFAKRILLDGLKHIISDGAIFHAVDKQFGVALACPACFKEQDRCLIHCRGNLIVLGILKRWTETLACSMKPSLVPRTVAKSRSRDMVPL